MARPIWNLALAGVIASGMLVWQTAQAQAPRGEVRSVDQVDLNRYAGKWYEIARFPMYFQRKCASDVNATYTLQSNGRVKVDNRCTTAEGRIIQSVGEAAVVNPPANSRLAVSFLPKSLRWIPLTKGDYWILRLDPEYKHVLVGEPKRRYLWVLSREPQMDEATLESYLETARQMGFDTKRLLRTRQTATK